MLKVYTLQNLQKHFFCKNLQYYFLTRHFNGTKKYFSTITKQPLESFEISKDSVNDFNINNLKEGTQLQGFLLEAVDEVAEFNLKAFRFTHNASGAQYLHVHRDDNNNAFSVGFRTTPKDSTGLPHILEHTTLCGSAKYPVRDPFFKMLTRSLATFMNATTGPDYTIYPFSTQNYSDYKNLMSVYLDAVFRPQLREVDFKQEGWRLEHEDIQDPSSPIVLKGIVFNEMKGVFADNQNIFCQKLLNSILPSHTYGYVSGGDPICIPELSYNDLKAFHKKYYSPPNSRFYSYGNFPLINHLQFINECYLSTYESLDPSYKLHTAVPSEKRWESEKHLHINCRNDPMAADLKKQSTIAISFLCSDILDIQESFELYILSELLIKGSNAPFYKALVEPNIGAGFAPVTGYDAHTRDTIFSVGLQGVHSSDFVKVVDIFDKTVDDVIQRGFETKNIEAVLHSIELNMKHQSTDFGLRLLFGITPLWNHDGDIIKGLKVEEKIQCFREHLKNNPKYLQDKVAFYLKHNKHRLILSMSPDDCYESKIADMEKMLLERKLHDLNDEKKKALFDDGLKLHQEQLSSCDISCLPTLYISDLKKTVDDTPLINLNFNSIPLQVCIQPMNGISHFRGVINTSHLSNDLKCVLPLFCEVLTQMGTKKHSYRDLDQLIQLKTGGTDLQSHISEDVNNNKVCEEGIIFSSLCLDYNVEDMFQIWTDIFNEVTLNDIKRLETLVHTLAVNLTNGIVDMGHMYAMSLSSSYLSSSYLQKEILSGITYVRKMRDLAQLDDITPVLTHIQEIASQVLNKNHIRCAINLGSSSKDQIISNVETFLFSLPGVCKEPFIQTCSKHPECWDKSPAVHHILPIPVNFVARSIATVPYTHPDFAPLRVLAHLVTSKYLHPNIREKGGAYGSGANISESGILNFFSYRDPNSTLTLDIFDKTYDWISEKKFTIEDINEAKLGVFQKIDRPIPPGSKGINKFLYGIDDKLFQNHREALMKVSWDDFIEISEKYLRIGAKVNNSRALIGPENKNLEKRENETWEFVVE